MSENDGMTRIGGQTLREQNNQNIEVGQRQLEQPGEQELMEFNTENQDEFSIALQQRMRANTRLNPIAAGPSDLHDDLSEGVNYLQQNSLMKTGT